VNAMECNVPKVPGIDGLPVEFYKAFWKVMGEDFLGFLNKSIAEGSLPLSCRMPAITLPPKKGDFQEISLSLLFR